jgi:hypothetical protein
MHEIRSEYARYKRLSNLSNGDLYYADKRSRASSIF